jgi:hypothetical protein
MRAAGGGSAYGCMDTGCDSQIIVWEVTVDGVPTGEFFDSEAAAREYINEQNPGIPTLPSKKPCDCDDSNKKSDRKNKEDNSSESNSNNSSQSGSQSSSGNSAPNAPKPSTLQTAKNTITKQTAKALNKQFGETLRPREWGRALEALKKDLGLPNNFHGKILSDGSFTDSAGNVLGNISHYLP